MKPVEEQRDNEKVSVIPGQSGRSLIIDPSWKNPSGEYRVGVKRAYELFPTELVARLKKVRTCAWNQLAGISDIRIKLCMIGAS